MVPAPQRFVSKRLQECNWLQAMEGGIDSSHVSWLHRANVVSDPLFRGAKGNEYNMGDMKPVFEVVESDGGLYIGARRNAGDDGYYWRITQYVHAVLHHDRAARRPHGARPFLDSDRRRKLLGVELRLSPGPRHHRCRTRRHDRRQGRAREICPRHLPAAGQQGQ